MSIHDHINSAYNNTQQLEKRLDDQEKAIRKLAELSCSYKKDIKVVIRLLEGKSITPNKRKVRR